MYSPLWRLGSIDSPSTLKFWRATRTTRKIARVRSAVSISSRIRVRRFFAATCTSYYYYLALLSKYRYRGGYGQAPWPWRCQGASVLLLLARVGLVVVPRLGVRPVLLAVLARA